MDKNDTNEHFWGLHFLRWLISAKSQRRPDLVFLKASQNAMMLVTSLNAITHFFETENYFSLVQPVAWQTKHKSIVALLGMPFASSFHFFTRCVSFGMQLLVQSQRQQTTHCEVKSTLCGSFWPSGKVHGANSVTTFSRHFHTWESHWCQKNKNSSFTVWPLFSPLIAQMKVRF